MDEYEKYLFEEPFDNILVAPEGLLWKDKERNTAVQPGVAVSSTYPRHFSIDSIEDIIFTYDKVESATSDISLPNQITDGFLEFRHLDQRTLLKDYEPRPITPVSFNPERRHLGPLYESKETSASSNYKFTPRHSVFVPRSAPFEENEPECVDHFRETLLSKPLGGIEHLENDEDHEFGQHSGSRRHSIASGQNVFSCPWPGCSRFFSRAYNLRSHYLIHSGSKPYICEYCGLSFARNHDMRRHLRVHSGEKPFTCSNCDKGFSRQDALTRHRRSSIKCQNITGNFPQTHYE